MQFSFATNMESGVRSKVIRLDNSPDVSSSNGSKCSSNFVVKKPTEYSNEFPSFRQPTEIGCFSLDGQRRFRNDNHQMKYLVMPELPHLAKFDLNQGFETAVRKDQSASEKLDNILHWIVANKSKVAATYNKTNSSTNQSLGADFVCYRGLLTQLVCTVYENKEDWLICATKFHGTIYLCEFHTEKRIQRERNQTPRQQLMSSWGYKFEQFMTADKPNGKPNPDVPVNENEEFCVSVKGRLGTHSLLFAAEVDGVAESSEKKSSGTRHYVELKTSRIITTESQDYSFCRYKVLKWWAQSFLIGISKVICGFRDDNGIVQKVTKFQTKKLPAMGEGLWSASVGMNFCKDFLQYVKDVVVKDDPNIVYKFYWHPGQDVSCEELCTPGKFQILPEWYIKSFSVK